jgi:hypothetical protein
MSEGSSDDGAVWMSKRELAAVRGISVASADRLVRRQGWRRQPGNDGSARILVPPDFASPPATDKPRVKTAVPPGKSAPDVSRAINSLSDALAVLKEQVQRERVRADKAEAEADRLKQAEAERRGRLLIPRLIAAWRNR